MKIDKRNPLHWYYLLQQGVYALAGACARRLSRKPQKPLVILYGHQLSGNLKALYHEWLNGHQHAFDCYFLSLDPEYSRQLFEQNVNVLRCQKLSDMLLVGRADAIITDHGLHAMSVLMKLTNIKFIDVWHGIPYKGFIAEDFLVQHDYDEVWVSSDLLKEIYQTTFGFRPDIVHNMGYARVDKLFLRSSPAHDLLEQASIPADQKIVLYAPTWQQDDQGRELFPFGISQDIFIQRVSDVCKQHNATLVIRSHLNARIGTHLSENVRYCSMKEFPDSEALLQHTDILICDWSSIAFDFLALDRPTIFLDVAPPFKNGFSLGPEYRFGAIATDLPTLEAHLTTALGEPQRYYDHYLGKHQSVTAQVYGENTDGTSAKKQLGRLASLISRHRQST